MGLWHGVEYYEKEKIVGEEFYQQWSSVSIELCRAVRSQYGGQIVDVHSKRSDSIFILYKTLLAGPSG